MPNFYPFAVVFMVFLGSVLGSISVVAVEGVGRGCGHKWMLWSNISVLAMAVVAVLGYLVLSRS